MRILLVGNYPPDGQESMQRFAQLLHDELDNLGVLVTWLRPKPWFFTLAGPGANPHRGVAKFLGYLDKFVVFPWVLHRHSQRHDIVHICDHSNAMLGRWLSNKPWLLTCHDLLAVRSALGESAENPTRWSGRVLQAWILHWLERAPKVVCVSDASRADFLRLTPGTKQGVEVIHNGLNFPYRRRTKEEWQPFVAQFVPRQDVRFVFHVGGNQWYKNRMGVMALFSYLVSENPDLHLVFAGRPPTEELRQQIMDLALVERIHFIGAVSNSELEALYNAAEFLLFPSLAEGFGWPVIEAQACGCRVTTSNRAPMPEVGGESCVYLELDDPEKCKTQLLGLLNESNLARVARIEAGLENVKRFEPRIMAERYLELYEHLIEGDGTTGAKVAASLHETSQLAR